MFDTCENLILVIMKHEPICGIKDALDAGHIHQGRYDAYMSIRNDIESQRKRF